MVKFFEGGGGLRMRVPKSYWGLQRQSSPYSPSPKCLICFACWREEVNSIPELRIRCNCIERNQASSLQTLYSTPYHLLSLCAECHAVEKMTRNSNTLKRDGPVMADSNLVDFLSGSTDSAINFSRSADLHTPIQPPPCWLWHMLDPQVLIQSEILTCLIALFYIVVYVIL